MFLVSVLDIDGHYIFVNSLFQKKFSFLAPNLIGQPYILLVHPEDAEKYASIMRHCYISPDEIFRQEIRVPKSSDNDYTTCLKEISILKNNEGEFIGILDISYELNANEQILKKAIDSNKTNSLIISNINTPFFIINRQWKFFQINRPALQIFQLPKSKIIGKSFWEIFPDSAQYKYPIALKRAMQAQNADNFEESWEDKFFDVTVYGSPLGVVVFLKDITEKKLMEVKLKDSENKLRAMLNSKNEIRIFVDKDCKILYFNKLAQELALSEQRKNFEIGADLRDFLTQKPKEELQQDILRVYSGQSFNEERVVRVRGNRQVWVENNYFPVYDEENKIIGVCICTLNVSERKNAELALLEKNHKLREIAQLQSHGVRKPVATIKALLDIIKDFPLDHPAREWVDYLVLTINELDEVVHKIVHKADGLT